MVASVQSPTDIVNLSLADIGFKGRISNLYDGSAASKKALDVYGQTRDALLRKADFGFAEHIISAVLTGAAAPAPWSVEYVYPTDCIRVRDMFGPEYLADKNNPLPVLYTIANAAAGRVIWTNEASATLVYTSRVTDPTAWDVIFIESLVTEIGKRLAMVLTTADAVKMEQDNEKMLAPIIESVVG